MAEVDMKSHVYVSRKDYEQHFFPFPIIVLMVAAVVFCFQMEYSFQAIILSFPVSLMKNLEVYQFLQNDTRHYSL